MTIPTKERNEIFSQGKRAALNDEGAFTCPYIDDDARFAVWIRGYEVGELTLHESQPETQSPASRAPFWSEIKPIKR